MIGRRNTASYIVGFGLSLATTLLAYALVQIHVSSRHLELSHAVLVPLLVALALTQLVVQLVCFLHLGREDRPRWRLAVFGFMVGTLVIVVFGSMWIMNNLNYHMMSPDHLKTFMHENEGL